MAAAAGLVFLWLQIRAARAQRKRKRDEDLARAHTLWRYLTLASFAAMLYGVLTPAGALVATESEPGTRVVLARNAAESTLSHIVASWPDQHFKSRLRVTRNVFALILEGVRPLLPDNQCRNAQLRHTSDFKLAVCLYHLAQGGTFIKTADAAGIGVATARQYVLAGCLAILKGDLRRRYMPKSSPETIELVRQEFALRRGIGNVVMAADGTHVPWRPDDAFVSEDYHNYKGWHSINVMAFVDSYYRFVDAEVGWPGRANDAGILEASALVRSIRADREAWLGTDGLILADGGMDGVDSFFITPFAAVVTRMQQYFNFCHSSTRFFVEQTFGALPVAVAACFARPPAHALTCRTARRHVEEPVSHLAQGERVQPPLHVYHDHGDDGDTQHMHAAQGRHCEIRHR